MPPAYADATGFDSPSPFSPRVRVERDRIKSSNVTTRAGALALLVIAAATTPGCGGSTEGSSNSHDDQDPCARRSLGAYCGRAGVKCPKTPEEVPAACAAVDESTSRRATECGGSLVVVTRGTTTEQYFFAADDHLVGFAESTSSTTECDAGALIYGTTCEAKGMAVDQCISACVLGSLGDYCNEDGHDCPASPEAVTLSCGDGSHTYRSANACGGVNLQIVVVGSLGWSFDDAGRLVGALGGYDTAHYCEGATLGGVYGTFCKATDDGEDLCAAR